MAQMLTHQLQKKGYGLNWSCKDQKKCKNEVNNQDYFRNKYANRNLFVTRLILSIFEFIGK